MNKDEIETMQRYAIWRVSPKNAKKQGSLYFGISAPISISSAAAICENTKNRAPRPAFWQEQSI
jgi:hypothetical protein